MNFRRVLINKTQPYHLRLESQYPFNFFADNISHKHVNDFLVCMKSMFLPYLNRKKDQHSFYKNCYSVLSNYEIEVGILFNDRVTEKNSLHLDYLFLGFKQGNEVLVDKFPQLLDYPGASFFNISVPDDLWKDFLNRIESVSDKKQLENLITDCCQAFEYLIAFGEEIEKTKV